MSTLTTQPRTKTNTLKVAIYVRCSSIETDGGRHGMEMQREKAKDFVKLNNYHLDEKHIYTDIGSGDTGKRPGLQKLLTDAKNEKFNVIIVYKFDRFFRNPKLLSSTVADLRKIGIELMSVTEPFDNRIKNCDN